MKFDYTIFNIMIMGTERTLVLWLENIRIVCAYPEDFACLTKSGMVCGSGWSRSSEAWLQRQERGLNVPTL